MSKTARWLHFLITVKGDLCLPNKTQIAHEILAYLAEHPDAQDTLDGIVQWWLLERKIKFQVGRVTHVLEELVAKGLIFEQKTPDFRNQYRINKAKKEDIHALLSKAGKPESLL